MRRVLALCPLVPTILLLAPPAAADPVEVVSLEEIADGPQDAEAAPGPDEIGIAGYPSNCYAIEQVQSFVNTNPHPLDGYWSKHALAWKAHLTPSAVFTQPPNNQQPGDFWYPFQADADELNAIESGNPTSYFAGQTGNVDPTGAWQSQPGYGGFFTLSFIALAVAHFETPVYVNAGSFSPGPGDMTVFGVERMAVATEDLPLDAACDVFDPAVTPADCVANVGAWWALGDVEGVAFATQPLSSPGSAWRTSMSGLDFQYNVLNSPNSTHPNSMVYDDATADPAVIQRMVQFAAALQWTLVKNTDTDIQPCPDFALEGPSVE